MRDGGPVSKVRGPVNLGSRLSQESIVLTTTFLLAAICSISLRGFMTVENIFNLARSISILGILGLGAGLVVITAGMDLSVVAVMAASWMTGLYAHGSGLPLTLAVPLTLSFALVAGALNGAMIAYVEIPPLFATLASSLVLYGLAYIIAPAWVLYAPKDAEALLYLGQGKLFGIPMPIVVFVASAVILHCFLKMTSFGKFIYAMGTNWGAARLTGIGVRSITLLGYMISAFLAWLAGLVWIGSAGTMQLQIIQGSLIFDVILVVVVGGVSLIGGRGSVVSVLSGCALVGTLLNILTIMNVNGEVQNVIRGAVLLTAILLDNRLHPRDEETARQGD